MAKIIQDISLLDIAPPSISQDKNIHAAIKSLDPELKLVTQDIQDEYLISRINYLPENIIDLLAWQWHVDFYEPDLDLDTKRNLVFNSIKYHRKKGTKYAIQSALAALGFKSQIKEWFEPDMLTPAHTFSITGYYEQDNINVDFLGENTEEILKRVVEITKPVRSSMIYLLVAPPPMDLSDHVCYWDICNWEHFQEKIYNWGILTAKPEIFYGDQIISRYSDRKIFVVHDTSFWDINRWDFIPYRNLLAGPISESGFYAELEWGEGDRALLFPNLWDSSKWDYAANFSRLIGSSIERIFVKDLELDKNIQIYRTRFNHKIICDLRPKWNKNKSWQDNITWSDESADFILTENSSHQGFTCNIENVNIFDGWSKYLTWNKDKSEKWDNSIHWHDSSNWEIQAKTWPDYSNWHGNESWNNSETWLDKSNWAKNKTWKSHKLNSCTWQVKFFEGAD